MTFVWRVVVVFVVVGVVPSVALAQEAGESFAPAGLVLQPGPVAAPAVLGDLDGDGRDDAVTVRTGDGESVASGRRGVDGEVLWQTVLDRPVTFMDVAPALAVFPAGDLDGDGVGDVLIESFASIDLTNLVIDTSAVSGADGTVLWSDQIEISTESTFSGFGEDGSFSTSTSGMSGRIVPIADVTGDGFDDALKVTSTFSVSTASQFDGDVTVIDRSFDGVTDLLLLDGRSGTTTRTGRIDGIATVEVVDDGDGGVVLTVFGQRAGEIRQVCGGGSDACQAPSGSGLTAGFVGRLAPTDLAELWTVEGLPHLLFGQPGGDLNGDGAPDVVLTTVDATQSTTVRTFDQVSGEQLLTVPADPEAESVQVLGVVQNPRGGADLLVAEETAVGAGTPSEVGVLRRLDQDGEERGRTTITHPDGAEVQIVAATLGAADSPTPDDAMLLLLTGDRDLLLSVEDGPSGAPILPATTIATAVDEVDGVQVADLDGDGTDTLLLRPIDLNEVFADTLLIDPSTAAVTQLAPPVDGASRFVDVVGDLDGQPGVDLLAQSRNLGVIERTAAYADPDTLLWTDLRFLDVSRAAGPDRIATAIAISGQGRASASTAVLATADTWPDAVTGGPLAAAVDGPLLLTAKTGLDPRTAAELTRLGVDDVVLLGGTTALSAKVDADLADLGIATQRIAGATRFETAAATARQVIELTGTTDVVIAGGVDADPQQGWADALSAAGTDPSTPVVLTDRPQLSSPVTDLLAETELTRVTIVGDTTRITPDAESDIRAVVADTTRVSGTDRYDTSAQLATDAISRRNPTTMWIATGAVFPDALAVSAAVADDGVLLLVDDTDPAEADRIIDLVRSTDTITTIRIAGGPAAISDDLNAALRARR